MSLIMLKLFIAVILQSYNDIKIALNRLFNDKILETFKDNWKEFDPEVSLTEGGGTAFMNFQYYLNDGCRDRRYHILIFHVGLGLH